MMMASSCNFHLDLAPASKSRESFSTSSTESTSSIPDMIMSASLQSFAESAEFNDDDSLSSSISSKLSRDSQSPTSAVSPPRSIFGKYWSSPVHQKSLEEMPVNDDDDDKEVLTRLLSLQMPLVTDDMPHEDSNHKATVSSKSNTIEASAGNDAAKPMTRASCDDTSVDYNAALPGRRKPGNTRRQILPTPPPATAISSSLILPRRRSLFDEQLLRSSLSSSALLARRRPQSCLRKSRYSCSAIVTGSEAANMTSVKSAGRLHHGLRNEGCHNLRPEDAMGNRNNLRDELKKSVSFYSQVSVFEFAVPADQRRSQKGWSKYFA
mmetsp:Transcript_4090/g.9072  ORF Transcript_4090/g.9072 Transcript_4090/m.9072 type:complete len:323 (-) Transcript_4090:664-1632(-)